MYSLTLKRQIEIVAESKGVSIARVSALLKKKKDIYSVLGLLSGNARFNHCKKAKEVE